MALKLYNLVLNHQIGGGSGLVQCLSLDVSSAAMSQRSFNRLMAVFTVVIILFLFAASYLHAENLRIPSIAILSER